jgi:hypothetical protein
MPNSILDTDKYKNAPLKIYTSISALSEATGLDKKILRIAKQRNFTGFKSNGVVHWHQLRPIFESRYNELINDAPNDIKTLKEELAKRDIILKDLAIKKLERNLIEPDDIKKFLVELATKQSVVIKKELLELPPRLAGRSEVDIKVEIDKVLQTIFKVMQEADKDIDKLDNEPRT